jgi:putative Mn2+ efflux pump MntP
VIDARMSFLEIILIAIGLSMDAFAVSITLGLSVKKVRVRELFLPGIYFGMFQALMPLLGYYAGTHFAQKIKNIDHWIAFALLGFIGGKMIKESFSDDGDETDKKSFHFVSLFLLAFATSIDAMAAGITFSFFEINIIKTAFIIGFTTFCISIGGVQTGNIFGIKYKAKAERAGGIILILLGLKILLERLLRLAA